MDINIVISFFAWSSIINIGLLTLSALLLMVIGEKVSILHGKLFKINPGKVRETYFYYLGNYKIAIIVFNIVPYFTLTFMI